MPLRAQLGKRRGTHTLLNFKLPNYKATERIAWVGNDLAPTIALCSTLVHQKDIVLLFRTGIYYRGCLRWPKHVFNDVYDTRRRRLDVS